MGIVRIPNGLRTLLRQLGIDVNAAASLGVLAANITDVQAIKLDTVIPTDAVEVAGTIFTAVASGATGNEFNVGADDAETATNLAAKIDALSGIAATAEAGVVTVTSGTPGVLVFIFSGASTMSVASVCDDASVLSVLHNILVELESLSARVADIEGS